MSFYTRHGKRLHGGLAIVGGFFTVAGLVAGDMLFVATGACLTLSQAIFVLEHRRLDHRPDARPASYDDPLYRAELALDERVQQLPERARTAFWCLCAEALIPLYEEFQASFGWGSVQPLRDAVDLAWSHVETGRPVDPGNLHDQLLEVAPDDNDFEGRGRPAQDATICAAKALSAAEGKDPGSNVDFAMEPLIMSLEDRDDEAGTETNLLEDPAVIAALEYLTRLVEQLPAIDLTAEAARAIPGRDALRPAG